MRRTKHGGRRPGLAVVSATAAIAVLTMPGGTVHAKIGLVVDDDRTQCRNADFTSIQAAVNAATPGTTIRVCPGTYSEQVTIPDGKDALSLESKQKWRAIIKAPPVMAEPKAIVRVAGATGVTIRDFTITGPSSSPCDMRAGVRVDAGGAATVERNHIIDIRDEPLSSCPQGNAVQIESATGGSDASLVKDNLIERYQKNGVVVVGADSVAVIEKNVITGAGPTATIAQNGIQISGGASGTVTRNTVSDNIYTPRDVASTGILLDAPAGAAVDGNDTTRNDIGIYAHDVTGNGTIQRNTVSFSTFDGIAILDSTNVDVIDNRSTDNGVAGTLFGPGIGAYGVTHSTFEGNRVERNLGDGLFFDIDATDNSISDNRAKDNTPFDCEDFTTGTGTSGTANQWTGNRGDTENVAGLCTDAQPEEPPV